MKSISRLMFAPVCVGILLNALIVKANTEDQYSSPGHRISYSSNEDGRQYIRLEGNLTGGVGIVNRDVVEVISRIKKGKSLLVSIHSGGGMDREFQKIANVVKQTCDGVEDCHVTTYVKSDEECDGYCLRLFMAGDIRVAGSEAHFGFLKSNYVMGPFSFDEQGTSERILKESGVNEKWLSDHPSLFDSTKLTLHNWLTPSQLEGSNIVTQIVQK